MVSFRLRLAGFRNEKRGNKVEELFGAVGSYRPVTLTTRTRAAGREMNQGI